MSPSDPTDATPDANAAPAGPSRLAGLLAPLRVSFETAEYGALLALEPARSADLIGPWTQLAARSTAMTTVLIPLVPTLPPLPTINGQATPLALGDGAFAVTTAWFAAAQRYGATDGYGAVLVDGPVEAGDVRAIAHALARGEAALDGELRAVASLQIRRGRLAVLELRDEMDAASFVGAILRRHVAAMGERPLPRVATPDAGLLMPLLHRTGRLAIRPIETELFSTFIDIGLSTAPDDEPAPADVSLIFDRVANSWHG